METSAIETVIAAPVQKLAKTRLIHLDLLRGLAILMVLGAHLPKSDHMPFLIDLWHRGGGSGVDLFFVLSGFLIGGLLFDEFRRTGGIGFKRFIVRRGFKIWPSYLIYLAVCFVDLARLERGAWLSRLRRVMAQLWPNMLHIQNYLFTPFQHTWSLAVEEHFYLLLPLLLFWMMRRPKAGPDRNPFRAFPAIFIGLAVFCLLARVLTAWLVKPFDLFIHVFPTHLRMDSLMLGVLLAYLVRFHRSWIDRLYPHRTMIFLISVALFVPVFLIDHNSTAWMYAVWPGPLSLGAAGLVLLAFFASQKNPRSTNPIVRAVSWVGIYSYSIYLWHVPFSQSMTLHVTSRLEGHGIHSGWTGMIAIYVALAVVFGAVMYRIIEFPALAVRDRLFPARGLSAIRDPSISSASA